MRRIAATSMVAVALISGCGNGGGSGATTPDDGIEVAATAAPCDGLLEPADPKAVLPADLPALPGMTVYEKRLQGATAYYMAHRPGDDVVEVRDEAQALLAADPAYSGLEADAEPPAEAELAFEGPHEGSVQVLPLCKGHVRIRYKLIK
ncbi:MAG TPA: hypothetical protein VNA14_01505 [Mycobacteriales bacterium]|nr:hypothetical protein [Mycobacteriales bacterium]